MDSKDYVGYIKEKFSLEHIKQLINSFKDKKVLVIGDTIIDEYYFVTPKGRAIKDPMLSVRYVNHETYAGGIIAISNHLVDFVEKVTLVTLLGDTNPKSDFVRQSLKGNTELKFFTKENSPTIVKRRFISEYKNNKLFKIEYINDNPMNATLTQEIVNYLDKELHKYDLVVVGDFGHGFINPQIRRKLEEKSIFLAVNVQSNSANMGYNYFTQYNKLDFITMDEEEARLPDSNRFEPIEKVICENGNKFNLNRFLVTLGRNGCIYVNKKNSYVAPIVINSVKDTIGAGDSLFAISSLFVYQNADDELVPFIANCAGGIMANIMGNKESVNKNMLLSFIKKLYDEAEEREIKEYLNAVSYNLDKLNKGSVTSFVKLLMDTYNNDGTIYIFGNGGSAATASHFCGDLIKGVSYGLEKRFRAVCLNDNTPSLMAIANDISYDDIFIEQLKNFLKKEDMVIGISGSGNSVNVVKALEYAKERGAKTSAICGFKGGRIKEIADLSIHVEVDDMELSEDIHNLIIVHCVKRVLMNELNSNQYGEKYTRRISNISNETTEELL